jgi:hypothetical protein
MDIPLRIGSAEAFARVRQFCRDADFDDATVCRTLAVKELHQADELDWANVDLDTVADGLRWCIDVLFRGLPAPESQSRAACGDAAFAAFFELGLLEMARHRPDMVISPVWVYPVDGFLMVSDRRDNAAGATAIAGDDVIFPGIDAGTVRFLHFMPDAGGGEALAACGAHGSIRRDRRRDRTVDGLRRVQRAPQRHADREPVRRSLRSGARPAVRFDHRASALCAHLRAGLRVP